MIPRNTVRGLAALGLLIVLPGCEHAQNALNLVRDDPLTTTGVVVRTAGCASIAREEVNALEWESEALKNASLAARIAACEGSAPRYLRDWKQRLQDNKE